MTVYHGTDRNIDNLDVNVITEENANYEYYGKALYFTDNIELAKCYGSNIFELDITDYEFMEVDANFKPIKDISDVIVKLINEKKNIKLTNVSDRPQGKYDYKMLSMKDFINEKKYIHGAKIVFTGSNNNDFKKINSILLNKQSQFNPSYTIEEVEQVAIMYPKLKNKFKVNASDLPKYSNVYILSEIK